MLGILLVNKPLGITSHDAVHQVRKRLGTKRVGHAGTLDPLATGLLVVAVGPATRFLQYLPLEPKEYVAEITFGHATTTFDREGTAVASGPIPVDLPAVVAGQLPNFLGLIEQIPPMFSAVKMAGKPLYEYARSGEEVDRKIRRVHIGAFEIAWLTDVTCTARIVCSGGTYIRTLAHDLGEAVGCGAHLSGLKRTKIGEFSSDDACSIEEIHADRLLNLKQALSPMPTILLDHLGTRNVREGRRIALEEPAEAKCVALLEPGGTVFSIARVDGKSLQPECVIPAEAGFDAI